MKEHRRQRRTPEERKQFVEQQMQSGMAVDAFCAEHNIGKSTFAKWKRKLNDENSSKTGFRPVTIKSAVNPVPASESSTTMRVNIGAVTLTIEHGGSGA